MMTDQQMHDLSAASGPAFDNLFLRMMIKHHGAGVTMAQTELFDGENADAQQLAQNISDSQQAIHIAAFSLEGVLVIAAK